MAANSRKSNSRFACTRLPDLASQRTPLACKAVIGQHFRRGWTLSHVTHRPKAVRPLWEVEWEVQSCLDPNWGVAQELHPHVARVNRAEKGLLRLQVHLGKGLYRIQLWRTICACVVKFSFFTPGFRFKFKCVRTSLCITPNHGYSLNIQSCVLWIALLLESCKTGP